MMPTVEILREHMAGPAPTQPPTDSLGVAAAALRVHPEAAADCFAVLQLLEELRCDPETRSAWLRFRAWELAAGSDAEPRWPEGLHETERRLLDGQLAARRVWELHGQRAGGAPVEGLRRLLLAIIGDVRVVFILLARQLVALRAAGGAPAAERVALARLTADIHAPLANRLGIWQLKWELEDLAFRYLEPLAYKRIVRLLDERRTDREAFIRECMARLQEALAEAGIRADIAGRPKHIFSIWKKMQRKDLEFSDLYDIRAVRVLVEDVRACYEVLGIVHALWSYIPGEFDDYIARPKGNDYRSLHTAVHGPEGKVLEVQIRTHAMHEAAELGVAAHWRYKESGGSNRSGSAFDARIAWLRQLLDERGEDEGDAGLFDELRGELQEDRVYLLSPRGDVYDLPAGATVLDFAYRIHSEVGHRCRGAKVNGRIVPLGHQPRSGDRIEVLTAKEGHPSRDWLLPTQRLLNTEHARAKVRSWFRKHDRDDNIASGQALLDRELRRLGAGEVLVDELVGGFRLQTREEFLIALALGEITPRQVARALERQLAPPPEPAPASAPARETRGAEALVAGDLQIAGMGNLLTHLARCCEPLPGDAVCGFITRGHGITVHRVDCAALARLRERDAERVIEVSWGEAPAREYRVRIEVSGYDRRGLQKDVTAVISNQDAHIVGSNSRLVEGTAEVRMDFVLKVRDFGQLSTLLARLDAVPNVIDARRVGES